MCGTDWWRKSESTCSREKREHSQPSRAEPSRAANRSDSSRLWTPTRATRSTKQQSFFLSVSVPVSTSFSLPSPEQCQPRLLPTYHNTLYPLFIYTLSTIPSSPSTSIFLKVNE